MKKVILVDGNNLMFRSYYATLYSGAIMKNSSNLPTNALFGFTNMINKIVLEENPTYMCVAFDIGKNFRKAEYDFYKEGRQTTPEELKIQMPYARKILDGLGIKYIEQEPYEADDIIGTIVNMAENDDDYVTTIVSSDKDFLQLISDETEIKLLKQSGCIRYTKTTFMEEYKIEPIRIIDMKALMGDASDNIPGVKGIGEKGALKLLQTFNSLEEIYDNIELVSGRTKELLINDKEKAFMSKKIATIYKEVPINTTFDDMKYEGPDYDKLKIIYEKLEFHSFLKNLNIKKVNDIQNYKILESTSDLILEDVISIYLEVDDINYHKGIPIGLAISDKFNNYFIKKELIKDVLNLIKDKTILTYDLKKLLVKLGDINCKYDLMIAGYLLNYNIKDDIALLMNEQGEEIINYDMFKKSDFEDIAEILIKKSRFILNGYKQIMEELENNNQLYLFDKIEMPLISVLAQMEKIGFKVEKKELENLKQVILKKLDDVSRNIFELSDTVFNISSPKQLGEVLFDKLDLAKGKKNKIGYKTDVKTLHKLIDKHPVIAKILEYRNLSKLYSTYIIGLEESIFPDGKIHTIFNQTLTRTGRLSSSYPNLQNIPIKEELGRNIRKSFIPNNDLLLSADYSQIELRVLSHISKSKDLQEAFINNEDIHKKVAADIYGVSINDVTNRMRSTAKAVIFGIVYGISGFGLGENLDISRHDADEFIKKYYEFYPGVKIYMDNVIASTKESGFVKTLFGRIRNIDEIKSSNKMISQMGERMALNTPIQGSSADIMKLAMIKVYDEFKKNNLQSKMILQVHDEIIVDVIKSEEEIVAKIVKDCMENAYKLDVPLIVQINTGINWYEVK